MKIAYKHLMQRIPSQPSINEISKKLFQLGHEHEIKDNIFDIEFTPNRGDCLSIKGLLQDLAIFYDVNLDFKKSEEPIQKLSFDFTNKAESLCPNISFMKIEIDDEIKEYSEKLNSYFNDLKINKNNFFTDISNYLSYELGQPTHCYDATKIDEGITLKSTDNNYLFKTLQDIDINLIGNNLVFLKGNEVINLAGVMGGKNTSCDNKTKSVIIECAFFNPEEIIGKSVQYNLNSDAAYKFERGVDPICQEHVLRRFLHLVKEHASVKSVELFTKNYIKHQKKEIKLDVKLINRILGTNLNEKEYIDTLLKLNFKINNGMIEVPSYRHDIANQNDLSEEIARSIGYDNLPIEVINFDIKKDYDNESKEDAIKNSLIHNGFYEVVNNSFEKNKYQNSIKIDNPLDTNRQFLRVNLKNSLIENLLFNEKRQKDSIKLFEISDIYDSSYIDGKKRVLGIIATGRVGKNYIEFPQKINKNYLTSVINDFSLNTDAKILNIPRDDLDSKQKNEILYIECDLSEIETKNSKSHKHEFNLDKLPKYKPISDFPSSCKDLSFSIKNFDKSKELENELLSYSNDLLVETFIFDYYKNKKNNEIKLGCRFIFQAHNKTITDNEVKIIIGDIIERCLKIESVSIPGLHNGK